MRWNCPETRRYSRKFATRYWTSVAGSVTSDGASVQVVVDEPVQDQMHDAAHHPVDAASGRCGTRRRRSSCAGRSCSRRPGTAGSTTFGSMKKYASVRDQRRRRLLVPQVVEVDDQPEHEHRAEDRPDRPSDHGAGEPVAPRCATQHGTAAQQEHDTRAAKAERQVADADQHQPDARRATRRCRGRAPARCRPARARGRTAGDTAAAGSAWTAKPANASSASSQERAALDLELPQHERRAARAARKRGRTVRMRILPGAASGSDASELISSRQRDFHLVQALSRRRIQDARRIVLQPRIRLLAYRDTVQRSSRSREIIDNRCLAESGRLDCWRPRARLSGDRTNQRGKAGFCVSTPAPIASEIT